jgi:murein peptide amidase A
MALAALVVALLALSAPDAGEPKPSGVDFQSPGARSSTLDARAGAREVVGRSVRERRVVARSWGDRAARRRVLVVGSIHGDETQGHRIVKRLTGGRANRLRGVSLWTIETANPDGVAARTRGNAHSVDLNRNFPWNWERIPPSSGYYSGPRPASEPETKALRRFLRRLRPEITIYYHQPWGRILIPCDRRGRRVALRYARLSGLAPRDCFASPAGSATGYQGHRLHQRAFVVELPGRDLRAAEVRRHARAVAEIAQSG